MAKRLVKKTSLVAKIAVLIERIEALENQGFAQKLMIDELENKLEKAEKSINDFHNIWSPVTSSPYNGMTYGAHACQAGYPDMSGNATCIVCGKHVYTVTTTLGTSISTSTLSPIDVSVFYDSNLGLTGIDGQ